jgi:TolA-binding protein
LNIPPPSPDPADQALGRKLVELLDRQENLPAQRIQALLPDLLGPDPGLLNPLRDLVGRPAFLQLLQRREGAGRRQLKHALLEELAETYSERVMVRLEAVLDGVLPKLPCAPQAGAVSAPLATAPAELRRQHSSQPRAGNRTDQERRKPRGVLPLVALTGAITLVSGSIFAALRSDLLCPTLGICLSGEARGEQGGIDAALARGEEAAEALEGAAGLEALNNAVERLNSALLKLVSQKLNNRQEERRQRLQALSDGAQRRLRQERRAEDHLSEASRLIERLERGRVDDDRRFELIQEARTSLASVPGDSFAATAALGLQRRLELIRSRPGAAMQPTDTPAAPVDPAAPPDSVEAPVPSPPALPPPSTAPQSSPAPQAPLPPTESAPPPPTDPPPP